MYLPTSASFTHAPRYLVMAYWKSEPLIDTERPEPAPSYYPVEFLVKRTVRFSGRAESIRTDTNYDNYGGDPCLISFSVFFDTKSCRCKFVNSRMRSTSVAWPHAYNEVWSIPCGLSHMAQAHGQSLHHNRLQNVSTDVQSPYHFRNQFFFESAEHSAPSSMDVLAQQSATKRNRKSLGHTSCPRTCIDTSCFYCGVHRPTHQQLSPCASFSWTTGVLEPSPGLTMHSLTRDLSTDSWRGFLLNKKGTKGFWIVGNSLYMTPGDSCNLLLPVFSLKTLKQGELRVAHSSGEEGRGAVLPVAFNVHPVLSSTISCSAAGLQLRRWSRRPLLVAEFFPRHPRFQQSQCRVEFATPGFNQLRDHSSVGPVFRPTHSWSASLSQGRLLVPVSVVFQGRTTTMLRCTLHVCGSRRSSDGDVQPPQLVPSRKRRHHINPRHIVIGVSWTVFPLASSAVEQLFPGQQSRICRTLSCILGLHELLLARKGVVSAHVFHHATFAWIAFFDLESQSWCGSRLPFVVGHPFFRGCF